MALVDLTKQIAQQALLSATKDPAPASQAPDENVSAIIFGEIHAMQKALKEDEELVVWFASGAEKIRVMEIFLPSPRLAVLKGFDADRNVTRVLSPVESLQLVAKVMKVQPGVRPAKVGLLTAKPKDSSA